MVTSYPVPDRAPQHRTHRFHVLPQTREMQLFARIEVSELPLAPAAPVTYQNLTRYHPQHSAKAGLPMQVWIAYHHDVSQHVVTHARCYCAVRKDILDF